MPRQPGRWREWLARFVPGELAGLLGSYLGYLVAIRAGLPPLAAAYGAALGENCGYYAAVFVRDWYALPATERRAGRVWKAMLHDFGLAEALDTTAIRPGATVLAVALLGTAWGVGVGKVVADLAFYLIAVTFWERRRRREGAG